MRTSDTPTEDRGAIASGAPQKVGDGLIGIRDMVDNSDLLKRCRWLRRSVHWGLRWTDVSLRIFLAVFLLSLVVGVVDPFGLKRAGEVQSQRVAARMFAPFYGMPSSSPTPTAQDHIAVVLIDDHTLRSREYAWPPRYSYYDEMLRRVLAQQPRAVYVDIVMEQRRDYDDSYQDARAGMETEIGCGKAPVFFGVSAPGRRSIFSGVGAAAPPCGVEASVIQVGTVTAAQDVVTSWKGLGSGYPMLLAAQNVRDEGWMPPLATSTGLGADYRSVALALYQIACHRRSAPGCSEDASALTSDALGAPLSVQWGSTLPRVPAQPEGLGCLQGTHVGWWERLADASEMTVHGLRSGLNEQIEDQRRQRCGYTLTVFEEELDDPAVAAVLKDRVVLIGTHLSGLSDQVISPVHQKIPGVYLHAMALDNLMSWGSQRIYRDSWRDRVMEVVSMVIISFGAGAALMLTRRSFTRWSRHIAVASVCVVTSLLLIVISRMVLRQPPDNWISVLLIAVAVIYAIGWREIRKDLPAQMLDKPENRHA
ncbi:CHASE2 domain-containing protein [Xanthomonas nasturtii]|uniref:CHASE2 domain-containing protein n=1 Tax=Xanthomonas nasturtii TaxID=1843581 RepID=UPI002012DC9F|nr:CHASE2 domain-containing protein [Xanthomonas nasturtii]MCL1528771.1 CHASE2 domain-containing protein [Xanthomonas nasturtii]MCL1536427.1 CHASE2 domain-containing protein [Xanthomonas nasturtii]MCL1545735.1 CHASE2 domain-containing protein [Xanthomonas nasturtii]